MRADAKALGNWKKKKKNSKCSPSVLKKKKMSGRKEVTSKDFLLLKISLYLKSPSVVWVPVWPSLWGFLWLKAGLGTLGSSTGISHEGTLPSSDTLTKSCTATGTPWGTKHRAWLGIPLYLPHPLLSPEPASLAKDLWHLLGRKKATFLCLLWANHLIHWVQHPVYWLRLG